MFAPLVVHFIDLHGNFLMRLAINRVPNTSMYSRAFSARPNLYTKTCQCGCYHPQSVFFQNPPHKMRIPRPPFKYNPPFATASAFRQSVGPDPQQSYKKKTR
uniref:Uncharacterized protein n=1 Tax=Romanomermis culicivorax TaxID=13658 RepID=A0A915KG41_ROMCU